MKLRPIVAIVALVLSSAAFATGSVTNVTNNYETNSALAAANSSASAASISGSIAGAKAVSGNSNASNSASIVGGDNTAYNVAAPALTSHGCTGSFSFLIGGMTYTIEECQIRDDMDLLNRLGFPRTVVARRACDSKSLRKVLASFCEAKE